MQSVNEQQNRVNPVWADLLKKAVTEPGIVAEAYRLFHSYSLGNAMAATFQCHQRGIPMGPLNTYPGWKALGRTVQKGQKAIVLCMPLTVKAKAESPDDGETVITGFTWKPKWFVLSQTEGEAYQSVPHTGEWSQDQAFEALAIQQVPFDHHDGNVQGFAQGRAVAVSPIAALPHKTLFHELAHVVLGHTSQGICSDAAILPKALREVEAEAVALLLCETLQLPGADFCRGYIQHWWSTQPIPEQSAQRIFSAAYKIFKAGQDS